MTVRRRPLLLLVSFWFAMLLVGLLGLATAPSVALADGGSGWPLPGEGVDTTGGGDSYEGPDPQEDEKSALELLIYLVLILL